MKTPRIAKSRHANAIRTLAAVAQTGETTVAGVMAHLGRRKAESHTWCIMEDLRTMGLLEGHGQCPVCVAGIPATYTVTDLGRVVLAWSKWANGKMVRVA